MILLIILVEYQVGSCIFKSGAQRKGHMIGHIYLRITGMYMTFNSIILIYG